MPGPNSGTPLLGIARPRGVQPTQKEMAEAITRYDGRKRLRFPDGGGKKRKKKEDED